MSFLNVHANTSNKAVESIKTLEQYNRLISPLYKAANRFDAPPVYLKIGASWCGPCKTIDPAFAKMATDHLARNRNKANRIRFYKIELDDNAELQQKVQEDMGLEGIPFFVFFEKAITSETSPSVNDLAKRVALTSKNYDLS